MQGILACIDANGVSDCSGCLMGYSDVLLVLLNPRSSSERFGAGARPVHPICVDPLPTRIRAARCGPMPGLSRSPDKLAFAVGAAGNTFTGHGMRWDNSSKNAHYPPIRWSSQS